MGLLHDLDDIKRREFKGEDFDHSLDVPPPAAMGIRWNGEKWAFGFAEWADHVHAFGKEGGKYYAKKTDLLNPRECGVPLEDQQPGSAGRLGDRGGTARGARSDRTR